MTRAFIVLTMSLLLGGAQVLRAQSARELLGQGVQKYQALEYDAAAALLEESLGRDSSGLADSLRARALTYLGATELFRGQRDSAVATFRHLVLLNPRYRPDELIFPPQVTNLFQEVRRATRAIAVAVPPVTELRTRIERFTARVLTSSLADCDWARSTRAPPSSSDRARQTVARVTGYRSTSAMSVMRSRCPDATSITRSYGR